MNSVVSKVTNININFLSFSERGYAIRTTQLITFRAARSNGGNVLTVGVKHCNMIVCEIRYENIVIVVDCYTVEPLNKGHLGTQAAVPYSEVVPYWEVRDKTVILCTFTASMMYKTHYGVIK